MPEHQPTDSRRISALVVRVRGTEIFRPKEEVRSNKAPCGYQVQASVDIPNGSDREKQDS